LRDMGEMVDMEQRERAYSSGGASSSIKRARWIKPLPKLIRHKGWTIASDQDNIYLLVYIYI
jgi:hypothetical protein